MKKKQLAQSEKRAVFLEITNMLYSMGAEHYYGKLKWGQYILNPDGKSRSYDNHEVDLKHPMSAKLAKYLNKKDSAYFARYKAKDLTERFDSPLDVIKVGIEEFQKIPGENILVRGRLGTGSAVPLLAWPPWFEKEANRINALAKEWLEIDGYGVGYNNKRPGNPKRAEEIDNEWGELVKQFGI